MFGKIKKDKIYICGTLVCQTRTLPIDEKDIFCTGKNGSMFAYDLDNLVLIRSGDYYINLETINSNSELQRVIKDDKFDNTYTKNKALTKESLQKIADSDDHDFDNQFFVVKDNLIPYNDEFATEYIIFNSSRPYLTFKELKTLSNKSVIRRNGIDNLPIYSYGEHQPRSK